MAPLYRRVNASESLETSLSNSNTRITAWFRKIQSAGAALRSRNYWSRIHGGPSSRCWFNKSSGYGSEEEPFLERRPQRWKYTMPWYAEWTEKNSDYPADFKLLGFGGRLLNEIRRLAIKDVKIKIYAPPERKYSTWIGGSILAGLNAFKKVCRIRSCRRLFKHSPHIRCGLARRSIKRILI